MNQIEQQNQTPLNQTPPAQLWIGPDQYLSDHAKEYIQKQLCPNNGCNICTVCTHIRDEQHHAMLWIRPEKRYNLEQLNPIFQRIAFALEQGEQFFFIIHNADFLTPACANALLKPIEEPPPGYHFVILAQRLEQLLPTIRSRCVIKTFAQFDDQYQNHPLFSYFIGGEKSPLEFMKILDQSKINEHETTELFDALLKHWMNRYKKAITQQNTQHIQRANKMIEIFTFTNKTMPMPGSSKLFWRNLFLQTR